MKIHHLNCGSMCPARFGSFGFLPKKLVCHCLLIETSNRLILIDTGLGSEDLRNPRRLGPMSFLLGLEKDPLFTAQEQVKLAGYTTTDVTDLIVTHLDLDHAGGIKDFPGARVNVARQELEAARSRSSFRFRNRYRAHHIEGNVRWSLFEANGSGEKWNGFDAVKSFAGLPPEILLVNLPGHSPGHFGVAVEAPGGCLLHAGDAFYDRSEIAGGKQPLWAKAFEIMAHWDKVQARKTAENLRKLAKAQLDIFCSHDSAQFQRLQSEN